MKKGKFKLDILIKNTLLFILISLIIPSVQSQEIIPGSERLNNYINKLVNKKIAVIANNTSIVRNGELTVHLIDTLLKRNIEIEKIFSPEHGFLGDKDDGEKIEDGLYKSIEVISLYGKKRKISDDDLQGIDIIIFDIQDVGVRFYTHISTLHYVMQASAENNIPLIVLDRPNPNGHYVDGPVLEIKNKSFVGMHEVPIIYGLTIGEYAKMINEEGWLNDKVKSKLHVVELKNYDRQSEYDLPIIPSPNLPNKKSINLYPSLCLFEGTNISVGRGTNLQFQIYGSPFLNKEKNDFQFNPTKNSGSKYPKHENKLCYGKNLSLTERLNEFNLEFILKAYKDSSNKSEFFNNYFIKLAGVDDLKNQIISGYSQQEIKESWQKKLEKYKLMRKKYLIYK